MLYPLERPAIVLPETKLVTDPSALRLTIDPNPDEVARYGKQTPQMNIVYARQPLPSEITSSIFLAGPTPRDKSIPSWRPEALKLLEAAGFKGHVFVPEDPDGSFADWEKGFPYEEQVSWEEEALHRADVILFWIPREMATMPALTTNDEYGFWKSSGKVVLGAPPEAAKVRYQQHYAKKCAIPSFDSLEAAAAAAVARVGEGAERVGGECQVPLLVWNTESFQNWYQDLKRAGNRLDGARMLWNFRVGPKKSFVFAWALHVDVHVTSEGRNKINEVVISRTGISSVLLYQRGETVLDTKVVLVREFRSPASTDDGFIRELPGGSSQNTVEKSLNVAVHEVEEETGFKLDPSRLRVHGKRQLAGTFSAHKADLFSAELTEEEIAWFEADAKAGTVHGEVGDSERTYVEVCTVREVLRTSLLDWTTLGMILSVLSPEG